jgi:hypothetical protein
MNQDWSDDEDNISEEELIQPNRDFPISDEEEDEDDYDMIELAQMTIKKQATYDLFEQKNNDIKNNNEKIINNEKVINNKKNINIINKEIKNTKRTFNPRLPPPNKYNKNNNIQFTLNSKDFPTL